MATPLLTPRNGMPQLVETESDFEKTISALSKGSGDIAIDAERASGYRYSQRAYLIQIFRRGGGLHLIDPIPLANSRLWNEFNINFSKYEWVIHASTQDLPCLIGVGLKPNLLFDTELGARIAGCDRVGLGPLAESLLEIQLAKEEFIKEFSGYEKGSVIIGSALADKLGIKQNSKISVFHIGVNPSVIYYIIIPNSIFGFVIGQIIT